MCRPRDVKSDELSRDGMISADTARSKDELRGREEVPDLAGLGFRVGCGTFNREAFGVGEGPSEDTPLFPKFCSEDSEYAGLPGRLVFGVFDREIQTPSTSIPLSIALTPKGMSGALRFVAPSICIISFRCASFVAAIAVYLRSLQRLYKSLTEPPAITPT